MTRTVSPLLVYDPGVVVNAVVTECSIQSTAALPPRVALSRVRLQSVPINPSRNAPRATRHAPRANRANRTVSRSSVDVTGRDRTDGWIMTTVHLSRSVGGGVTLSYHPI